MTLASIPGAKMFVVILINWALPNEDFQGFNVVPADRVEAALVTWADSWWKGNFQKKTKPDQIIAINPPQKTANIVFELV